MILQLYIILCHILGNYQAHYCLVPFSSNFTSAKFVFFFDFFIGFQKKFLKMIMSKKKFKKTFCILLYFFLGIVTPDLIWSFSCGFFTTNSYIFGFIFPDIKIFYRIFQVLQVLLGLYYSIFELLYCVVLFIDTFVLCKKSPNAKEFSDSQTKYVLTLGSWTD